MRVASHKKLPIKKMFSWLNIPKVPDATWPEFSTLYIEHPKTITYSEIDREEFPVVYRNVPSLPVGGRGFGLDFTPLTFLSCFSVYSHQGKDEVLFVF
jgi:hypothetical protein